MTHDTPESDLCDKTQVSYKDLYYTQSEGKINERG